MFSRRTNWSLTPNRYSVAIHAKRASGATLLDLTASNPTTIGLRFESERVLAALSMPEGLRYEPAPNGMLHARRAVSAYYAGMGFQVSPDSVVLSVSTSEAYSYCFRLLCDPGDEVLVPQPSYPLFEFLADLQDVRLVPYRLLYDHGWQIDFHSLEAAISNRTRAVLLVNPNNPTGSYVKTAEQYLLNSICSKHQIAIIADEVFLDYSLGGPTTESFVTNDGALTFTLSGLSKICALPQMKLAWTVLSGPPEIVYEAIARLEVIADTYLSVNAPIQWALESLLSTRSQIQEQLIARIRRNLSELDSQLNSQSLVSRLKVEAGWYAILRVPATRSDEELSIELIEKDEVLVQPGHFYDFGSDGYLVISLITPEREFQDGLKRVLSRIESEHL